MNTIPPGTPVRLRASGLSGIVREIVKGGYRVEIPTAAPLPGGLPHTAIVAADELEVQATASEAHRIASARLGPALRNVTRGGPNGDEWLVQAVPPTGPLLSARAARLEEAIGEAEAQLRAAGWVPTHPRLEWRRAHGAHELRLCIDHHAQVLFSAEDHWKTGRDGQRLYNLSDVHDDATISLWECPAAEVFAYIAEWCATNLPSLHLPPFPGASDAS